MEAQRTPLESVKRIVTCCYRFELQTVFLGLYSSLLALVYFSVAIHNAPGKSDKFDVMSVGLIPSVTYEVLVIHFILLSLTKDSTRVRERLHLQHLFRD